jgi:MFS family permease
MLATAVQMGVFAWAWYAWQPYFLELLGQDLVWVAGVVAALLAISMMLGNWIVGIVTRWCGRRTTLFLWAGGVFSIALIGVGVVDSFVPAVALLFLGGVALGVQMPVRQAFVHNVVPSEQRATVVSFDSMISGGGSVVGQTGLGALSDRQGFSAGYVVGGLITLLALPLLGLVRRQRDDSDFFGGSRPEFAGAAPAVPVVSGVDGRVTVDDT